MDILIFGTGRRAAPVRTHMESLGFSVVGWIDNNERRVGSDYEGLKVYSPFQARNIDAKIFISIKSSSEVVAQLVKLGMGNRILFPECWDDFRFAIENTGCYSDELLSGIKVNKNTTIVFDSIGCNGYGGVEVWNYKMSLEADRRGYSSYILRDVHQPFISFPVEKHTIRVDNSDGIVEQTGRLLGILKRCLPLVLVNNWNGPAIFAAYALKQKYPESVQIISIEHFDKRYEYESLSHFSKYTDQILCVSTKIKRNLEEYYCIPAAKLFFKETAIDIEEDYALPRRDGAVQIGFACRLEKEQKRVELLPELIDKIEEYGCDYQLNIAGKGSYEKYITDYITNNRLEKHINFIGYLPPAQMGNFWKKQDVYINFSDFEGTSQAMLEAMSFGVVPIVTPVSGVDDFVHEGENGFIVPFDDMDAIASIINEISCKRDLIHRYGQNCREIILKKCHMKDYFDFFENIIRGGLRK